MLFMLHCVIEPKNRDENLRRLKEARIGEPSDIKVLGAWLSVTQLEGWVIFDAPDAAAVATLFRGWTDLNVNDVTPILGVDDMLQVFEASPSLA
jgi:hypothetical protein